jgi:hypothetical protein
MVIRSVLILLPLITLLACGDEAEPADPGQPNELVFTRDDGTTFKVVPSAAKCDAPSESDAAVKTIQINYLSEPHYLFVEVVPHDDRKTYTLPVDAGDYETGLKNANLFYGERDAIEVSTSEEDGSGTLEVVRATCDPVALELNIDGHLDSELNGGVELDVKGHIEVGG